MGVALALFDPVAVKITAEQLGKPGMVVIAFRATAMATQKLLNFMPGGMLAS